MAEGVVPSKKVYARIGRAVKHFEQTYINPGLRGEKVVRARRESCRPRNEVWKLKITGTPTGGSWEIDLTVNGVRETVTINYDDTASEVKTAFATHSELVSTDLDTSGGPFPSVEILVEFIDRFEKTRIFNSADNSPVIDDSGLTGGTGPAAWIIPYQPGGPANASP